jgi:excinuclease ABC subunit B
MLGGSGRVQSRGKSPMPGRTGRGVSGRGPVSPGVVGVGAHADGRLDVSVMPRAELADLIQQLNEQMLSAARDLQFEVAARLRDEIAELKREMRGMDAAGVR